MGKSTISMAIFNCYVSSPEGTVSYQVSLQQPPRLAAQGMRRSDGTKTRYTSTYQVIIAPGKTHGMHPPNSKLDPQHPKLHPKKTTTLTLQKKVRNFSHPHHPPIPSHPIPSPGGTDDEDLGRRHRSEGRGPGAREAREALKGVQHRAVALEIGEIHGLVCRKPPEI